MALRFRRGNEVDRTDPSFVPEAGEPIWILDTQRLYVGDGTTAGGVPIVGVGGGGSITGIDDNTTGVVLTLDNAISTFTNDVELDGGDLILAASSITGTGNINILGNITGSGTLTGNIANIGSLNVTAGINAGAVVQAPFFIGDHLGSVFSDDSTLIIDGESGSLTTSSINAVDNQILINSTTTGNLLINATGVDAKGIFKVTRTSETDLSGSAAQWGGLYFEREDPINGPITTGFVQGGNDYVFIASNSVGNFSNPLDYLYWTQRKLGIGTVTPTEALDVVGNGVFSGNLTAGAIQLSASTIDTSDSSIINVVPAVTFNSDVVIENSLTVTNTLTVDTLEVTNFQTAGSGTPELASDTDILLTAGTRVEITQSPLKMASFTTTERNALTPQNGDVIYNTTDSKFQGYAGGTWVNLH